MAVIGFSFWRMDYCHLKPPNLEDYGENKQPCNNRTVECAPLAGYNTSYSDGNFILRHQVCSISYMSNITIIKYNYTIFYFNTIHCSAIIFNTFLFLIVARKKESNCIFTCAFCQLCLYECMYAYCQSHPIYTNVPLEFLTSIETWWDFC